MENKWKNVMFCQVWSTYFPSSPGEFRSQSKASRARPPGTKSGEFQSPDKMKLKGAAMQVPRFRFASVHPVDQFIKLESWRTWWWDQPVSGYNLRQTPPFGVSHQGHQVLHSAWNGFSQKNHRFIFNYRNGSWKLFPALHVDQTSVHPWNTTLYTLY